MNMADRIQYLRKSKGISQEELADKVGVSRQAVVIQAVGVFEYFLAGILSKEKAPFYVNWLNIVGVAFIPVSMITGYLSEFVVAPYPIGILHAFVFMLVFLTVLIASYILLKKSKNRKCKHRQ